MNHTNMTYLLRSALYEKVKPEDLADLLSAGRPMVIVMKSLKVKYVGETNTFTAEEWARMVANGRVFVECGRERHYMAEHLNDDALPVLPVPIERVYGEVGDVEVLKSIHRRDAEGAELRREEKAEGPHAAGGGDGYWNEQQPAQATT